MQLEAEGSVSILPAHTRRLATPDGVELSQSVPCSPPRPSSLCRAFGSDDIPTISLTVKSKPLFAHLRVREASPLCLTSRRGKERSTGAEGGTEVDDPKVNVKRYVSVRRRRAWRTASAAAEGGIPTPPFASLKVAAADLRIASQPLDTNKDEPSLTGIGVAFCCGHRAYRGGTMWRSILGHLR